MSCPTILPSFVEVDREPIIHPLPKLQAIPNDFPEHLKPYVGLWRVVNELGSSEFLLQPDFTLHVSGIASNPLVKASTLQPARWEEIPKGENVYQAYWLSLLAVLSDKHKDLTKELLARKGPSGCIHTIGDFPLILQINQGDWDKPQTRMTGMSMVQKGDKLYVTGETSDINTLSRVETAGGSMAKKVHKELATVT